MRNTLAIGTLLIVNLAAQVAAGAQGCSDLLREGVYDSFNVASFNRSKSEWHRALCSQTVNSQSGSDGGSAGIGVVIDGVPIGISGSDASQFEQFYSQHFCTASSNANVDLSTYTALTKVVNPTLVQAYQACHKVENLGLQSLVTPTKTQNVFSVSLRYSPAYATNGPMLQSVSFAPAVVTCRGALSAAEQRPLRLSANWVSMQCTRAVASADVQMLVATDAGSFTYEVPPEVPPPTATQLVLDALPRGTILGWYDAKRIPTGWQKCDGSNGTPNLVDRYVMGTDGSKLGALVGSASHTHTVVVKQNGTTRGGFDNNGAFQVMGDQRQNHLHDFLTTVSTEANAPLGTQMMFIMKM